MGCQPRSVNSAYPSLHYSIGNRLVWDVSLDLSTAHILHYIILLAIDLYGMSAKTTISRSFNSAFPSLHYFIGTFCIDSFLTRQSLF